MKLPNPKTEQYHPYWDEGIRNPKKFKPDKFHKRYDRKKYYKDLFKKIDNENMNNKIKYTLYAPEENFRVDFYEQLVKPTLSWEINHNNDIVEYIYAIVDDDQITFIDGDNDLVTLIPSEVIVDVGIYLNLIKK
jgi:hypothetical protein